MRGSVEDDAVMKVGPGPYLAGAGRAVVSYEGSSVLVHFAVEQTASQRQIEHLPLTWRRRRRRVKRKIHETFTFRPYFVVRPCMTN